MRSYPVKENQIGSAVSEILRYKQTNRQTDTQTNRQTSFYFVLQISFITIGESTEKEKSEKNKQASVKDFFKKSDSDKKPTENKDKSYKESSEYKNKSNKEFNDSRDKSYKESNGSRDKSYKEPREKKKDRDGKEKSPDKKSRRVDIGHGYKVLDPLPDVFKNLKV